MGNAGNLMNASINSLDAPSYSSNKKTKELAKKKAEKKKRKGGKLHLRMGEVTLSNELQKKREKSNRITELLKQQKIDDQGKKDLLAGKEVSSLSEYSGFGMDSDEKREKRKNETVAFDTKMQGVQDKAEARKKDPVAARKAEDKARYARKNKHDAARKLANAPSASATSHSASMTEESPQKARGSSPEEEKEKEGDALFAAFEAMCSNTKELVAGIKENTEVAKENVKANQNVSREIAGT